MTDTPPPPDTNAVRYHYAKDGVQHGPARADELQRLVATGQLGPDDLIWTEGMPDWVKADTIRWLFAPAPPQIRPTGTAGPAGSPTPSSIEPSARYSAKSTATLYGWWLGLTISGWVLLIILIGIPLLIAAIVVGCILLYRGWAVIQDGNARTTPGRAVGFLFIPFFNFYWAFVAYHGLAVDTNRYFASRGSTRAPMSEGVALWLAITSIASIIPYAGWVAAIACLVLQFIFMHQLQSTVKFLAQEGRG